MFEKITLGCLIQGGLNNWGGGGDFSENLIRGSFIKRDRNCYQKQYPRDEGKSSSTINQEVIDLTMELYGDLFYILNFQMT